MENVYLINKTIELINIDY